MASAKAENVNLNDDIHFIQTPAAKPSQFGEPEDCGVPLTNVSLSNPFNLPESC